VGHNEYAKYPSRAMKYAIFFAGSGQKASSEKYVYRDWAERLEGADYETLVLDGVGEFSSATTGKWQLFKNKLGLSAKTGAGWAEIVSHAMSWLIERAGENGNPEKVVVVGMSRGGVQAVVFANCMQDRFKNTPVFVFAIDPVQGFHAINDGSFDMRDGRKGSSGSRNTLKAVYHLTDQAPNTIPENVVMYLSVLSQFRGSQRGVKWGFTPQSPTLGNMTSHAKEHKVYELPGDHSSGVSSGYKSKGGQHRHFESRQARSLVTRDMFFHWLTQKSFAQVERPCEWEVLDAYCRIANQDLGEVQFDGKNSGFSFLRVSRDMNVQNQFDQTAASRRLKGRGHLIASSQVAASQRIADLSLGGYYVNERHFKIYLTYRDVLRNELKKSSGSAILKKYVEIEPWVQHNRDGFAGGKFAH